jgi:hypothetical protein
MWPHSVWISAHLTPENTYADVLRIPCRVSAKGQSALDNAQAVQNQAAVDRVDVTVTLHLKAGRVEVPQTSVVRNTADDWRLIPASHVQAINKAVRLRGAACVRVLEEIRQFKSGIHAALWESQRLGMLAKDSTAHIRDLQMLRATAELNQVGFYAIAGSYCYTAEVSCMSGLDV